jgi:hypothetical protein
MRSRKEDLPLAIETPGGTMRVLADQGGMAVARYYFTAETDFTPLLAALPGGHCSVPHWGYVISGRVDMEYADGVREVYEAGQVYYQPPGHSGATASAGTEIVEFSPEPDYTKLIDAFKSMMRG